MTHPEGYTALDLVGFTDKGTYASNVYYVKNDIVHYAGALYRCKVDDTINVTPGENSNWTEFIGEPQSLVERIIAPLEDNPATVAYATGRQIIYDDYLWEVIDDIAVGDPLVDYDVDPINANIKKSLPVETQLLEVKAREGNLSTLLTTVKTTLVAAINELVGKIGDLTGLTTTAKTSAVAAINEVDANADAAQASANIVQAQVSNSDDAYDPTKAYTVGELCIYDDKLYRCTTACSAGSWATNQSCFTTDTLTNRASTLNNNLRNLDSNLSRMISGPVIVRGFADRLYAIIYLPSAQYYGVVHVITNKGSLTQILNGYDGTTTSTSGNIKSYKHDRGNGTYDIQIVFPDNYTHGVVIVGGSAAAGNFSFSP